VAYCYELIVLFHTNKQAMVINLSNVANQSWAKASY